jgi:hypothetical protein
MSRSTAVLTALLLATVAPLHAETKKSSPKETPTPMTQEKTEPQEKTTPSGL